MSSSLGCSNPSLHRPCYTSTDDDNDDYDGRWRKRVTFETSSRSRSDIGDENDHNYAVGRSRALLGTKMGTPYYCKRNPLSADIVAWEKEEEEEEDDEEERLLHVEKKPLRLIESGAVRVHIAQTTNPRRGADKHDSNRLIDQGALRLQITRHTTPRKKVNVTTRSRMIWPRTPSSSDKTVIPQTEMKPIRTFLSATMTATASEHDCTPSKHRSNAYIGGHKFRAVLSPNITAPIVGAEMDMENEENSFEQDLSRTLRFE